MNLIPRSKFGDCVDCGAKNTNCVKVGKELFCIDCRNNVKRKQQIEKYNIMNKLRQIGNKDEAMAERQMLIHDLDFVFSRYIRIREANVSGIVSCFTCDKNAHYSKMQLGHYIKRGETLLRWDNRNAKVQCPTCNCSLHGNMDVYTERLNKEYPGLPDQLREESRDVNKFSREELKQLLIDLRFKLKMVEGKLINE